MNYAPTVACDHIFSLFSHAIAFVQFYEDYCHKVFLADFAKDVYDVAFPYPVDDDQDHIHQTIPD